MKVDTLLWASIYDASNLAGNPVLCPRCFGQMKPISSDIYECECGENLYGSELLVRYALLITRKALDDVYVTGEVSFEVSPLHIAYVLRGLIELSLIYAIWLTSLDLIPEILKRIVQYLTEAIDHAMSESIDINLENL